MLFLIFTAIFWYFTLLFKVPMKPEYCVLILTFQIICYLMNTFIRNLFIYAGLHFLIFYVLYHLSLGLHASSLFTLVLIVLCIIDFNYWRHTLFSKTFPPSLALVILLIITSIHGTLGLSLPLGHFSYYAGIIYITLYLLRLYLVNIATFHTNNDNRVPIKNIINLNTKIVVTIILILFVFTILFQSKIIENFLTQSLTTIGLIFKKLIILILSLKPNNAPKNYALPPIDVSSKAPMLETDGSWLNIFFYVLGIVYQYLVGFAILGFFIFIICRFIIQHFHRTQSMIEEDSEFEVIEVREKIKHKKNINKETRFKSKSVSEKIRHLYKKRIHKLQIHGYKIQTTHTPLEREDDILTSMDENLADLTHLYNVARYGNESLNEKQFTQAKKSK